MIKNKNKFIFLTLFIAYTSVYIARVNLSMAGPQLIREGVLDSAQLGILGSCFFVVCAFGRIVNGAISDTAPPWVMLTPGLMLVGLGNILMSFFPPFIGMLLLWTINAYAQSMLWSSVLGSVTAVYDEQAAKRKMSVMITSVAVGNILGIIVNTLFIECFGIRYAFIVPGALTFVMGILAYAAVREIGGASAVKRRSSAFSVLKNRELMLMNGAAAAHGVMKENIGLWMAVYVADVYAADLTKSSYYILLIPAIGLLGRGIYPTLFRLCGKDENKVSLAAFAVCAAGGFGYKHICAQHIPPALLGHGKHRLGKRNNRLFHLFRRGSVKRGIQRCNKAFRLPSHVCFVGGYLRFVYIHSDCNQQKFGCARIAAQTAAAVLIEYSAFADLGKP